MPRPPFAGAIDPLHALARAPGEDVGAAVAAAVAELDRFGVERAGVEVGDDPVLARAALERHPERFFARAELDPRGGMDELRRLERLAREWPLRLVTVSPARRFVPIDDKRFWPVFAKCIELDLALSPSLGVPAEPVPFAPQKVERIDAVACAFPELRIVMRGGCEPWQALAVLLMRRHPNLSFASAPLPPSEIPAEVLAFANEDGAHQVLFGSDVLPASRERFYKELPALGLAPPVWRRFARDNAARILQLR
jgi:predicted TIM-barrel fold metal-dependent hydrolase